MCGSDMRSDNNMYEYEKSDDNSTAVVNLTNVQAFINNISFPKTLEELEYFIYEHGCFNVEDVLCNDMVTWTTPKWAKVGDIVFFMHSKTAKSTITKLRTQINKEKYSYTEEVISDFHEWIERGLSLYEKYGGKIFAIARVVGVPTFDEDMQNNDVLHWGSRIYANINDIVVLDKPIDISEFNEFIFVSRQSAITPVFGKEFEHLKCIIKSKNIVPNYLMTSTSTSVPLAKFDQNNWLELSKNYRRSFMLELQFRTFYVDYFLKILGDQKTIYRECRCIKKGIYDSFVDNIILFNGKYLPVEVKLNIYAQNDIIEQVGKYCQVEKFILDSKRNKIINVDNLWYNYCVVIDTENVYVYNHTSRELKNIIGLDTITKIEDILELRLKLIEHIL